MAVAYEVALAATVERPIDLANVVEVLSRTLTGLGLEGHHCTIAIEKIECDCDTHDEEDEEPTHS